MLIKFKFGEVQTPYVTKSMNKSHITFCAAITAAFSNFMTYGL